MLLAPFEVFSNAMLAERWFPDLVGWALAAAAMDLALLVLVLRLDADYLEWSTAISQRAYEQIERHAPERRVRDQSLAEDSLASGYRNSPGWAARARSPGGRWS